MRRTLLAGLAACAFMMASPVLANPVLANEIPASAALETVATFGPYQPIGVKVSSDNRLFVSFPNLGGVYRYGLTEVVDGQAVPFPDAAWNETSAPDDTHFASVQDLYIDAGDALWVLDSKPAPAGSIFGNGGDANANGYFKLVKFDIRTRKAERVYRFEGLDTQRSALNDVRVDTARQLAYLSDPGQAGIVVLDLRTGKSRTVLAGTVPTTADPHIVLSYEGRDMRNAEGRPFRSNVNSIALTRDNRWFYFKPINKETLYRIDTQYLADASLNDAALLTKVESVAQVGVTHGMEADAKGNIVLTTSLDYALKYVSPDGKLHRLVQDRRLIWPDSLGIGSDGYVYVSSAQVNRAPQWNGGVSKAELPYAVYRVKLP